MKRYSFQAWMSGYHANESVVEWRCPKCKHDHTEKRCIWDAIDEGGGKASMRVKCDECKRRFFLNIYGRMKWEGIDFEFAERK